MASHVASFCQKKQETQKKQNQKNKTRESDIMLGMPGFKDVAHKLITSFDNYACYLLDLSSQLDKPEFSKCLGWIFHGMGVLKNKENQVYFSYSRMLANPAIILASLLQQWKITSVWSIMPFQNYPISRIQASFLHN